MIETIVLKTRDKETVCDIYLTLYLQLYKHEHIYTDKHATPVSDIS